MIVFLDNVRKVTTRIGRDKKWSKAKIQTMENLYYTFLCVATKHRAIPTKEIDFILHNHMALGIGFDKDCMKLVGKKIAHKVSCNTNEDRSLLYIKTKKTMIETNPILEKKICSHFEENKISSCDAFINCDKGHIR